MAERRVVPRRLRHAGDDRAAELGGGARAAAISCSMPISSPVSSKIAAPPSATSRSKARPIAGLAVSPLVASEPPQIVPTMSSDERHRHARRVRPARQASASIQSRPSCTDRARAAGRLDADQCAPAGRYPAIALVELVPVEPLATERHQQHRADVRMRAQRLHHVAASRRSDSSRESRSDARRARGTAPAISARDVMRALHEIDDRDDGCGCPCARPGADSPGSCGLRLARFPGARACRSRCSRSSDCAYGRIARARSPASPSPIGTRYFTIFSPMAMGRTATLWPVAVARSSFSTRPSRMTISPASRSAVATAILSPGSSISRRGYSAISAASRARGSAVRR